MCVFEKLKSFIDKGVVESKPYKGFNIGSTEVLKVSLKSSELVLTKLPQPVGSDIYMITLDGDYICKLLTHEERELLFHNALRIIEYKRLLKDADKKMSVLSKLDSILGD